VSRRAPLHQTRQRWRARRLLLASSSQRKERRHHHRPPRAGAKATPPDYALVFQLEQHNLRDMVYEQGWQPGWARLLPIAGQLASALAHLHALRILHRWAAWG
jgi:hypothetical protein